MRNTLTQIVLALLIILTVTAVIVFGVTAILVVGAFYIALLVGMTLLHFVLRLFGCQGFVEYDYQNNKIKVGFGINPFRRL
jgi:hypothetical protein